VGNAYSTGTTSSLNYPTRNPFQPNFVNYIDAYVTKINTTLSGDSSLIYSTYLGGESTDYGYDITVDSAAQAHVTGYAGAPGFPMRNPFQPVYGGGGADAFITVFTASGSDLVYSSYLGGEANDFGRGVAIDGAGTTYIGGSTASTQFPTVSPYQASFGGGTNDAFLAKVYDAPPATVTPPATATPPPPTVTSTATTAPPTPTATPCGGSTCVFAPGITDIGNHCDNCITAITLPFPFQFYDQTFITGNVSSNGNLQFVSSDPSGTITCLPHQGFSYAILPHWQDLRTDCSGCGVFTSISGSAPNRVFNIEWRTAYVGLGGTANFELRLHENSQFFQMVYGVVTDLGRGATVGAQRNDTQFWQYACGNAGLYEGLCITPFPPPPPCPTQTPMPPTLTATRTSTMTAIVTSTSTSTACPIQFNDVDENNTFYANIRCLACRGIISGYADGTFRPNNQVTRGQLAKMVSNAAGFSEPVSGQTFQDVPPTQTFYEFIERLTTRGYMTGYICGSVGEPCLGRPYFRPFANATRGQTSKIVSNAARFTEPPVGQTFEDVPSNHTFYEFVQRLATRNVMQGYECGRPGEPCVGPENRPYFRPGNDVTRGQSSKIVANAFFPGCVTP